MSVPRTSVLQYLARFYTSAIRLSLKIIATSLAIGVLGAAPLMIYVAVGPADGKPIGLGLLASASVLLAQGGLMAGLMRLSWELLAERG